MIRFLTAGESHGQGLVVIVEGMPAGLSISEDYIGAQMARRQRGHGRGAASVRGTQGEIRRRRHRIYDD